MDIEKQYRFISEAFNNKIPNIHNLMEHGQYPKSTHCLYSKVLQIESIKNAIDSVQNNFYSSQVLLRVLIEHFLIGYYVFHKTYSEKSDLVGETFYNEYFKSETIKRENYYFDLDKRRNRQKHDSILGYLEKYDTLFKGITQSDINNIHNKASQFTNIKKIIQYLFDVSQTEKAESVLHLKMFDFLEKYNTLSSYVHGGIMAEVLSFDENNAEDRKKVIRENQEWGITFETNIKFFFLFLLDIDNPNEILKLNGFFNKDNFVP